MRLIDFVLGSKKFQEELRKLDLSILINTDNNILFLKVKGTLHPIIVVIEYPESIPVVLAGLSENEAPKALLKEWVKKYEDHSGVVSAVLQIGEHIEEALYHVNVCEGHKTFQFVDFVSTQLELLDKLRNLGYEVRIHRPKGEYFPINRYPTAFIFIKKKGEDEQELVIRVEEEYAGMHSMAVIKTDGNIIGQGLGQAIKELVEKFRSEELQKQGFEFASRVVFEEQF